MTLYRHFIKTNDGTICELEEAVPFSVDDYPTLDVWPNIQRKNLGSEDSRFPDDDKLKAPNINMASFKEPIHRDFPEENFASPINKRDDGTKFLEPQIVIMKND